MKTPRRGFELLGQSLLLLSILLAGGCRTREARVRFPNATVNGQPARLVFDSGSDQTRIFQQSADHFGLKIVVTAPPENTVGKGIARSAVSEPAVLQVGGQELTNQLPVLLPPWFMSTANLGDMLISWHDVRRSILVFDPSNRVIHSALNLPSQVTNWLHFKICPDQQLYLEIPLADGTRAAFLVDTGNPGGVILPPAKWDEWQKTQTNAQVKKRLVANIGGYGATQEAWADELSLGPLTLSDLPVQRMIHSELRHETANFGGTIGLYALARMEMVLDGPNQQAYLRPLPPPGPAYGHFDRPGIKPDAKQPATGQGDWTVVGDLRLDYQTLAASALVDSAFSKSSRGLFAGALADLTQAIALTPSPDYFRYRASVRRLSHDLAGAVADCTRALELDPNHGDSLKQRALIESALGRTNEAFQDVNRDLELYPLDPEAWLTRGKVRAEHNDLIGSIDDLSHCLTLQSNNPAALLGRGYARTWSGQPAEALRDLNAALKLNPGNPEAYAHRAFAKCLLGDFRGALSDCAHARKYPGTLGIRAMIYEIQGDFESALADWSRMIKSTNDVGVSALHRHFLLQRMGRPDEGFASFVDSWPAGWEKSVGLFITGKSSEEALKRSYVGEAGDQQATCRYYYYLGMARLLARDQVGARQAWEACLATERRDLGSFHFARAELSRLNGARAR